MGFCFTSLHAWYYKPLCLLLPLSPPSPSLSSLSLLSLSSLSLLPPLLSPAVPKDHLLSASSRQFSDKSAECEIRVLWIILFYVCLLMIIFMVSRNVSHSYCISQCPHNHSERSGHTICLVPLAVWRMLRARLDVHSHCSGAFVIHGMWHTLSTFKSLFIFNIEGHCIFQNKMYLNTIMSTVHPNSIFQFKCIHLNIHIWQVFTVIQWRNESLLELSNSLCTRV